MRDYPDAPWPLSGQLWLSLFRADGVLHGAAFVSYEEPSPLVYSELLVAQPRRAPLGRRVSISDIWVDSPASMAGGRELWAIPKALADFTRTSTSRRTTQWTASIAGRPVASARFGDVSRLAPRTPFDAGLWQPGLDGGPEGSARMQGTARTLPCRATWHFDPDGPLAFLHGRRPMLSARMADFRMSFG